MGIVALGIVFVLAVLDICFELSGKGNVVRRKYDPKDYDDIWDDEWDN